MTRTWVKWLATEEIWTKQNCLTYGLYDDFNYQWMWNLDEVIKQEINYILLNDWQNYCVECTLMVCQVWQERKVHEQKRENQYAKTLRESTTMVGDPKLVCNVIKVWYVLIH